MNLAQIQSFIKVAETRSFTKAAENMYLSQSAVSRQIAGLEQELNCRLFDREGNFVRLTTQGESVLSEFKNIYVSYMKVLSKTGICGQIISGTLKIGILDGMITGEILDLAILKFSEIYPEVSVELYCCDYKEIWTKLCKNELDAAFALKFEAQDYPELKSRLVKDAKCHIVLNHLHKKSRMENVRMSDFADDTFIIVEPENSPKTYELIKNICRKEGFEPKFKFAPSRKAQMLWCEKNMGICVFDTGNVLINDPNIKFLTLEDYICDPSMVAVWNKDNTNPNQDLFLSVLFS